MISAIPLFNNYLVDYVTTHQLDITFVNLWMALKKKTTIIKKCLNF